MHIYQYERMWMGECVVKWYQLSTDQVYAKLAVTRESGLNKMMAQERLKKIGPNRLAEADKTSLFFLFLKQFQDFMVLVLLAATLLAGLLGEYIDAIVIIIIVFINSLLGFFQEQKAENSLAKLKALSAPLAHVFREGEWLSIPSEEVVVGDILKLTRGDRVVADVRIVEGAGLAIEESALTGESAPVDKTSSVIKVADLDYPDQLNMAFMGTLVTSGHGVGVVVATGMKTMVGKIADLLVQTPTQPTPLERRLAGLGKVLIVLALLLTSAVVILGVWQGNPIYQMFLAGISLAVAAIPEGLPAIVTVALSLGVQRMIKKKAIVRKLSAVETLGSTTVICSDKTGTMTQNKMTIEQLYVNNQSITVTGGHQLTGSFFTNNREVSSTIAMSDLLLYGMICSNASIERTDTAWEIDGDPTEAAIIVAAHKAKLSKKNKENFRVIKEYPFDSDRKRMTVVVENERKEKFAIVKGAPDVLLPRVSSIMNERLKMHFNQKEQQKIEKKIKEMAEQALRTVC